MLSRRDWLRTSIASAASALVARPLLAEALTDAPTKITVYKSASCGCCKEWVKHLQANGFAVSAHDVDDLASVKHTMGVPDKLASCHTGLVGRYVIEGHVPADLIKTLLTTKPVLLGLAVPGMPSSAPGMDGPKQPYDVIAFERNGSSRVYARR